MLLVWVRHIALERRNVQRLIAYTGATEATQRTCCAQKVAVLARHLPKAS